MMVFAAVTDLTNAVAISNFVSLFYYAIANYAAFKVENPRYPRFVPLVGLLLCIMLLFFLTPTAWIVGILCLVVGLLYYVYNKKKEKTFLL
jgi:APA family basic amino acid/polyamine antiporter